MNFAPSTRTCRADLPLVRHQDHRPHRGRLRSSWCAVAVAAVALSVPSSPGQPSPSAATDTSTAALGSGPSEVWHAALPASGGQASHVAAEVVVRTPVRSLASTAGAAQTRRVCVRVANVRSGPGTSYRVMTTVRRGTTVRGATSRGWLKIRSGRWVSLSVTCRPGTGAAPAPKAATSSFTAWVRAIDPAGNAQWSIDHGRTHTRGNVRGLTVFRGSGPGRSTVYIQPGMTWAKTKLVMAHEAIHVRQIRYGGFSHSLRVFGSVTGMERAADCGATIILRQVVRGGCPGSMATRVRRLLAGRPA